MDIQYFGGNTIVINNKKSRVVIDDNLAELGGNSVVKTGDIVLFTGVHGLPDDNIEPKLLINQPGEYEVSNILIYGGAVRAHIDEEKTNNAVAYKLIIDDTRILVTGHIFPELSDRQLEAIGTVDIMLVPVGGNGLTTDGIGALKLIKKIEPKIVVPTHYDDAKLSYPVPQQTLEQALQAMSIEPAETVDKLVIKQADLAEGSTKLIVVKRA